MKVGDKVTNRLDKIRRLGVIEKDLGKMSPGSDWPTEQAWLVKFPHDTYGCWQSDLILELPA